jgi:cysteine desulfurase/selenocysteine lyase
MSDLAYIKKDFPFFAHNPDVHYLDSTATSLKPQPVIDVLSEYYETYSVNIHRGIYQLSEKATESFEQARKDIAAFIGGKSSEVVFTKNASESLNLLAYSLENYISESDEIITTAMEHHSNFVPWQQLALQKKAQFTVLGVTDDGEINFESARSDKKAGIENLENLISEKTKIVTLVDASNVLGTINPIKEIVTKIKALNPQTIVVVDACQSVPHMKVDVGDFGADFIAFSGHKMLGPTGVGVLWGKTEMLEKLPPFLFGGEMIQEVHLDRFVPREIPHAFEAGTPHIAGVIGLGAAVRYLENVGMDVVRQHEKELLDYAFERIAATFGDSIRIFGPHDSEKRSGSITFAFKKYHPHDIASLLDHKNIAVRAGQHCTMPLHTALGVGATTRASFYLYSTKEDVDALIGGLSYVDETLGR